MYAWWMGRKRAGQDGYVHQFTIHILTVGRSVGGVLMRRVKRSTKRQRDSEAWWFRGCAMGFGRGGFGVGRRRRRQVRSRLESPRAQWRQQELKPTKRPDHVSAGVDLPASA